MSNKIDLFWNGATDDHAISKYRVTYFLGNSTVENAIPETFVLHDQNAVINGISNTVNSGGATYSFIVQQYVKHTFKIVTIDNQSQPSTNYHIIPVEITTPSLRTLTHIEPSSIAIQNACILTDIPSVPIYLTPLGTSPNGPTPIPGTTVYTDISTTSPFNGNNYYWKILVSNIYYSVQISSLGLIGNILTCGQDSILHSGKVSNGLTTVNTTSSSGYGTTICNATLVGDIYYLGPIIVGTTIFTNYNNQTKKIGNNKYYLLSSDEGDYIVKILGNSVTDPNSGKVDSIITRTLACPVISSSCCFVAGTKITMFDLTQKNIEDVLVGDFILTYNEENKKQEKGEVKNLINPLKDNIVQYQLEDDTIIESTTCHPYWVIGKGWASFDPEFTFKLYGFEVSKINEDDLFLSVNNVRLSISKITILDIIAITYNLEINGNHTYYANNILVHNKNIIPNEPVHYLSDGMINPQWQTWYNIYHNVQNCSVGIGGL